MQYNHGAGSSTKISLGPKGLLVLAVLLSWADDRDVANAATAVTHGVNMKWNGNMGEAGWLPFLGAGRLSLQSDGCIAKTGKTMGKCTLRLLARSSGRPGSCIGSGIHLAGTAVELKQTPRSLFFMGATINAKNANGPRESGVGKDGCSRL